MASNPATIAHGEQAPPTVAACPKWNVAFVPVQVKESGSAVGIIGGLLILLGIIGLIGTLVGGAASFGGGLVLIGLGILVTSVGRRKSGLMCPNRGAQAARLSESAS